MIEHLSAAGMKRHPQNGRGADNPGSGEFCKWFSPVSTNSLLYNDRPTEITVSRFFVYFQLP
jgi:hypothetical protein